MRRRDFIASGLVSLAVTSLPSGRARAAAVSRVRPGTPGWPSEADWSALNAATSGRLARVSGPVLEGPEAKKPIANPFFIRDQAALTQSSGWLDAWRSSPSQWVVTAESASDVAAAVRFAATHNLRLVVKGGGHSYFGTSNAPDSLLLWTRKLNAIMVHDRFTPAGSAAAAVPAVSLGAGCVWLHAYQAVTGGAGRYVQGGGCATVGVTGLILGGGFGSFSKAYGLAAGRGRQLLGGGPRDAGLASAGDQADSGTGKLARSAAAQPHDAASVRRGSRSSVVHKPGAALRRRRSRG